MYNSSYEWNTKGLFFPAELGHPTLYLVNPKNESKKYTIQELLPEAFTSDDLEKHQTNHDVVE